MGKRYILLISMHADCALPPGFSEWGGTHTYMRELLDSFSEIGQECVFITRRCMEELPPVERYSDCCTIYRLTNGEHAPMAKTLLRDYHRENVEAVSRIIETHGVPLAIHSSYWNSGRIALELCDRFDTRMVHSVISNARGREARGASPDDAERAEFEQEIFNYADIILCVSRDERNDICEYYGIDPDKVWVAGQYIHSAYRLPSHDENGFPRLNSSITPTALAQASAKYNLLPEHDSRNLFWLRKAFTYFGRMSTSKGVDSIIEAWALLKERKSHSCPPLWMVGGSLREIDEIRRLVRSRVPRLESYEEGGEVVWWGDLDPMGVSAILGRSAVLVTNSLYEPGGRMVIEAMAEGVPVIASPNGFARDVVCDWRNGFLVDYGDVDLLARRLEHFCRQPFISSAMGRTARVDALSVMEEWSFLDSHLCAYGLPIVHRVREVGDGEDWFGMERATIFPLSYSVNWPSHFVDVLDASDRCVIEKGRAAEWRIATSKGIAVKRFFDRISRDALFNPIAQNRLTLSAERSFMIELYAHEALGYSRLIETDRRSRSILVHRGCVCEEAQTPDAISIVNNLARADHFDEESIGRYSQMVSSILACDDAAGIAGYLDDAEADLEHFSFPSSCKFSIVASWHIAHMLVEANRSLLSEVDRELLDTAANEFRGLSNRLQAPRPHFIILDIQPDRVEEHSGIYYPLDMERGTLGDVECEIADLLFADPLYRDRLLRSSFWESSVKTLDRCTDARGLACAIGYRFFTDAIEKAIMYPQESGMAMKSLACFAAMIQGVYPI